MIEHINPFTEEALEIRTSDKHECDTALRQLHTITAPSLPVRQSCLQNICNILEQNIEELASAMSHDMGKPVQYAIKEVQRCIDGGGALSNYAGQWLSPKSLACGGYLKFSPLGTSLIVAPWNFPVWVPFIGIASCLLAGNRIVFKPSELAPRSGALLVDLLHKADAALKDFIFLASGNGELGDYLVNHELVDHVVFTGSVATGRKIAESCGKRLIPCAMELGGLDAAIVLKDAAVTSTAEAIVRSNAHNSGQVCCCIKRVFVEKEIYADFLSAAIEYSKQLTMGNPAEDVDMGPLVSANQLKKVETFLKDAVDLGAKVETGGKRPDRKGFFFPSTVLSNLSADSRLLKEEAFGPLLPIIPVSDWKEGLKLGNNSDYGLAGSVWTADEKLGKEVAEQLDVGVAKINAHGTGPIGAPWAGVKASGLGQMRSEHGLQQCCKTTYIAADL